jgi:hypothetical protein
MDELHPEIRDWLGFTHPCGRFINSEGSDDDLVRLNDVLGWTFEKIADLIESEPYGLFV